MSMSQPRQLSTRLRLAPSRVSLRLGGHRLADSGRRLHFGRKLFDNVSFMTGRRHSEEIRLSRQVSLPS